jgi:hypothetical protein
MTKTNKPIAWLPTALLVAFIAVAAVGVLGLGVASFAAEAPAQTASAAEKGRRCPECAWIESVSDVSAGVDNRAIRGQVYTVRMVDGSSRVFAGGPAERWRIGERLKYIE